MDIQVERLSAVIDAVASPRFYPSLLNWLEGFSPSTTPSSMPSNVAGRRAA